MAGAKPKYRHLSRSSSHRQALLRNLCTSLFTHESISTTYPKAKEAQRLAEKLITLGKKNTEAARRRALSIFFVRGPLSLSSWSYTYLLCALGRPYASALYALPSVLDQLSLLKPSSSLSPPTLCSSPFFIPANPISSIDPPRPPPKTLRPPTRKIRKPTRRLHTSSTNRALEARSSTVRDPRARRWPEGHAVRDDGEDAGETADGRGGECGGGWEWVD